ncbi:MAG TPA: PAS domain S-box protein [Acidimicrobiia bacterium]|nr:PAS domain S-box protein [Acidimicrobiia bacterium]
MTENPELNVRPAAVSRESLRPLSDVELTDSTVWGLVDAAPDGIVLADEAGQIRLVNRKMEELFGYDRGDLLGRSVDDLLPDRLRQVHRAHRTRYRVEPRTRAMGAGLRLFGRRQDGTEFPVEISLSPLDTDAGLRVVAVVRDITDRVREEAESRRVRETLDTTRDAVLIFDADTWRFTYVNQGAIDQLGYTHDELLDMTMLHIAPEFNEAELRALLEPFNQGEISVSMFTTTHRRRDGTDVPVEIMMQPAWTEDGRPRAFVQVVRDVSERLEAQERLWRAEQDLRLFEDRERIARDLHDIVIQRLFAAGMAVQAVLSRTDDPTHSQRLASVVDELDQSVREIRTAIFGLQADLQTVGGLRAEILKLTSDQRPLLGFDPRVHFEGIIESIPDAIGNQLLAILREALSNVARHANASTVHVTVNVGRVVVLRVVDNGVGVSDADGTTQPDAEGGNGIRNALQRAESLGGWCTIKRGEHGGTVFEWSVPLE